LVHGESLRILIGFLAISIIRGRLSLFQYPQGINLHKIFYTPQLLRLLYVDYFTHSFISGKRNDLTAAEYRFGKAN
ncbi:hypothetical protein, partial [Limosilactobacillus fermentum]|uniref:hypothetical protein n=1 Tax=Limosilactobacillus fermentum TaxID=1613 RepID=UPI0021C16096